MLVIISDLHFTDGTTSNKAGSRDLFNIDPDAFRLFLGKISHLVERRPNPIQTVTFIYNGDIFDLLRTYAWFKVPVEHRPWSLPFHQKEVYSNCRRILQKILYHNDEALKWLSGRHPDFNTVWKADTHIERIFVPGNHDRLINWHPPCRRLIYEHLLGKPGKERFDTTYVDGVHKTIVMHGHEADPFNCEYDANGNPRYDAVPIGDPMTTALFAALGYRANYLAIPKEAKNRFREIDNIHPALNGVRYLQDIVNDFNIGGKVESMIQKVATEFEALAFYQKWHKAHDRWHFGLDEADKLKYALQAIKLLGTSIPGGLLEKVAGIMGVDAGTKLAQRLLSRKPHKNLHHCVMGHTHETNRIPLSVDKTQHVARHYLNSGTFRTTWTQTFDGQSWVRSQRMSFVVIYGPNEFKPDIELPLYEMWSGIRMRH